MVNEKKLGEMPGPMEYQPTDQYSKLAAPKFSFHGGGEQRPKTTESYIHTPGPGHYPSRSLISEGRKQGGVIGHRYKIKKDEPGSNNVPGPGTYSNDISPVKNKDPTWRIGTARREDDDFKRKRKQNFPAPTAYNPHYS